MQSHQIVGIALILAGVVDAAMSMWIPNRVPDERQRGIVRLALLSSGIVVTALGGLFLAGVIGRGE